MLVLEGESAVDDLRFTPDATRVLAAQSGAVDAWTLTTGERTELFAPLNNRELLRTLALHPTGAVRVTYGDQPVAVSLSGQRPHVVSGVGGVQELIISPGADWVIVARGGRGGQWLAGCRCESDLAFGGDPAWEALSHPYHRSLAGFVNSGKQFVTIARSLLVIRETTTGEVRSTVPYTSRHYRCCAVSLDGRRFAVMGYDKLYLWDTATWDTPTRVSGLNRWINSMAYHPTRPIILATQDRLSLVKYLDADTGKPVRKFDWKLGSMESVAFSPDGNLAAVGSASGKIVVWDVDV